MNKVRILKRKLTRGYYNPENREYSKFKGYPENTYFGYKSIKDLIKSTVKQYINFYGNNLRHWDYKT